jgi:hypothetical protein
MVVKKINKQFREYVVLSRLLLQRFCHHSDHYQAKLISKANFSSIKLIKILIVLIEIFKKKIILNYSLLKSSPHPYYLIR